MKSYHSKNKNGTIKRERARTSPCHGLNSPTSYDTTHKNYHSKNKTGTIKRERTQTSPCCGLNSPTNYDTTLSCMNLISIGLHALHCIFPRYCGWQPRFLVSLVSLPALFPVPPVNVLKMDSTEHANPVDPEQWQQAVSWTKDLALEQTVWIAKVQCVPGKPITWVILGEGYEKTKMNLKSSYWNFTYIFKD